MLQLPGNLEGGGNKFRPASRGGEALHEQFQIVLPKLYSIKEVIARELFRSQPLGHPALASTVACQAMIGKIKCSGNLICLSVGMRNSQKCKSMARNE